MTGFSRWLVVAVAGVALANATGGCTIVGAVIGASVPERRVGHSTELHPQGRAGPPPTWPPEDHPIEMHLVDGDSFKAYFEGVKEGRIVVDDEAGRSSSFAVNRVDSISWTTREGNHVGTGLAIGLLLDFAAFVAVAMWADRLAHCCD